MSNGFNREPDYRAPPGSYARPCPQGGMTYKEEILKDFTGPADYVAYSSVPANQEMVAEIKAKLHAVGQRRRRDYQVKLAAGMDFEE